MSVAIITGSAGLIGSEAARYFAHQGLDVVGLDNDRRSVFFGKEASTAWNRLRLEREVDRYVHHAVDIRHYPGWQLTYRVPEILTEIYEANQNRWAA